MNNLSASEARAACAGVVIEQFRNPGTMQSAQTAAEQKQGGMIAANSKSIRPRNRGKSSPRTRNQEV